MFKSILFLLLFFSLSLMANTLPEVPDDCFEDEMFCTRTEIVKKTINGERKKVINIKIFVVQSYDDISLEEITDRFFDFNSWDEYTQNEGSRRIIFESQNSSREMKPINSNGAIIRRHYSHYKIRSPLGYINVRAVGHYLTVEPVAGAAVSVNFENQTKNTYAYPEIPEEPTLVGGEGFKYTKGSFHIMLDDENEEYIIYFNADVIPGIDILLSVAKKPIKGGFESILKGMFDL